MPMTPSLQPSVFAAGRTSLGSQCNASAKAGPDTARGPRRRISVQDLYLGVPSSDVHPSILPRVYIPRWPSTYPSLRRDERLETSAHPNATSPQMRPSNSAWTQPRIGTPPQPAQTFPRADTMHFAGPPRKSSHPPPYAIRQKATAPWRRYAQNPKQLGVVVLAILSVLFLLFKLLSGSGSSEQEHTQRAPRGHPNVVLVTPFEPGMSKSLVQTIKQNREGYAKKHGTHTSREPHAGPRLLTLAQDTPPSFPTLPTTRSRTRRSAGASCRLCGTR